MIIEKEETVEVVKSGGYRRLYQEWDVVGVFESGTKGRCVGAGEQRYARVRPVEGRVSIFSQSGQAGSSYAGRE